MDFVPAASRANPNFVVDTDVFLENHHYDPNSSDGGRDVEELYIDDYDPVAPPQPRPAAPAQPPASPPRTSPLPVALQVPLAHALLPMAAAAPQSNLPMLPPSSLAQLSPVAAPRPPDRAHLPAPSAHSMPPAPLAPAQRRDPISLAPMHLPSVPPPHSAPAAPPYPAQQLRQTFPLSHSPKLGAMLADPAKRPLSAPCPQHFAVAPNLDHQAVRLRPAVHQSLAAAELRASNAATAPLDDVESACIELDAGYQAADESALTHLGTVDSLAQVDGPAEAHVLAPAPARSRRRRRRRDSADEGGDREREKDQQSPDHSLPRRAPRKRAHFRNAAPSNFCHVCTHRPSSADRLVCSSFSDGTCRKIVCRRCVEKQGIDWDATRVRTLCPHCRNMCPRKAQCATYNKVNDRIRRNRVHKNLRKVQVRREKKSGSVSSGGAGGRSPTHAALRNALGEDVQRRHGRPRGDQAPPVQGTKGMGEADDGQVDDAYSVPMIASSPLLLDIPAPQPVAQPDPMHCAMAMGEVPRRATAVQGPQGIPSRGSMLLSSTRAHAMHAARREPSVRESGRHTGDMLDEILEKMQAGRGEPPFGARPDQQR